MTSLPDQETVLIVEEELALLRMARRQLERNGYTVLDAPDARGAFVLLDDHPDIDLLLTDVVLASGPNGLKLARQFRQKQLACPNSSCPDIRPSITKSWSPNDFCPNPLPNPC